jgi:hypothetical protein
VAERTEPNKASPTTPASVLVIILFFNILNSYINPVSRLLAPLQKFYLAEQGLKIRCNSIHPAAILTPMWEPMLGGWAGPRGPDGSLCC